MQVFLSQRAATSQRAADGSRQLCDPVRRIEFAQLESGRPIDSISEPDAEISFGLALSGLQLQLRQMNDFKVTTDWALQREVTGGTGQRRVEIAQVTAIVVLDLRVEGSQCHGRLLDVGIEPAPGEATPGQLRLGIQTVLPIDPAVQINVLLLAGSQREGFDIGMGQVDQCLEREIHRTALALQASITHQAIALFHVTFDGQLQRLETQGVGQLRGRLETLHRQQ